MGLCRSAVRNYIKSFSKPRSLRRSPYLERGYIIRVGRSLACSSGPSYVPSRGHPHGPTVPSGVPNVGSAVRGRVPTRAHTERTRPRAHRPTTNQGPAATKEDGALSRRYVSTGSTSKTKTGATSGGRPVRTRQNTNVALRGPPPASPIQPIRCRARSHHTVAARHWPRPSAPHHAVREVDTKAESPESVHSQVTNRGWDTDDFLYHGKARATCEDSAERQNLHVWTTFRCGSCLLQFVS